MRSVILLLFMVPSLLAQTHSEVWKQVSPVYNEPQLRSAELNGIQLRAIARLVLQCCNGILDETQGDRLSSIVQCLTFQEIPLAAKQNVLSSADARNLLRATADLPLCG